MSALLFPPRQNETGHRIAQGIRYRISAVQNTGVTGAEIPIRCPPHDHTAENPRRAGYLHIPLHIHQSLVLETARALQITRDVEQSLADDITVDSGIPVDIRDPVEGIRAASMYD